MVWLLPRGGRPASEGGGGLPTAPLSITAPVVGTSRAAEWALQAEGATGPRTMTPYTNGTWNTTYAEAAVGSGVGGQPPNDPYLAGLGFIYNNYGGLFIPLHWTGADPNITVANYNFNGAGGLAPKLIVWGDANILFRDCTDPQYDSSKDANLNPENADTHSVQFTYCLLDGTTWSLECQTTLEFGPYNRVKNQAQTLGFGGGDGYSGTRRSIYFHHNYVTGGGCDVPSLAAHVEWWQQILAGAANGSYAYVEHNMVDFTKDGQSNPANLAGWTGTVSLGGNLPIKFNCNIVKGMDIVNQLGNHVSPPLGGMGCIIAYGDANVTAGFEFNDNAVCWNQNFGPTHKHAPGQVLKPSPTGNRWFVDADSAAAGVTGGPADNVELTLANFG